MARLINILALAMATITGMIISFSEARIPIESIHVAHSPSTSHHPRHLPLPKRHGAWAPTPSPDSINPQHAFYKSCLQRVSGLCGKEIYKSIFVGGPNDHVSLECCGQMVSMGKHCHKRLVGAMLALPGLASTDKDEIKRRDAKVWDRCVKITDFLSSVIRHIN